MSGYFDLDPDYDPLSQPSPTRTAPTSTARGHEGKSIEERHEMIALDMQLLVRDSREDIEARRAGLAQAIARSVDIEHSAKKLQHEAHVSRRHRVVGRFPPPHRPLGDGMG